MKPYYENALTKVYHGNCLEVLTEIQGISAVVTDPPYHLQSIVKRFGKSIEDKENYANNTVGVNPYARLSKSGFMGKTWDGGDVSFDLNTWETVRKSCKPGAVLLSFGGSRTFHRIAVAIEEAGWEYRDTIMWVYGSGFPKSLDISKAIDKLAGIEREDKFEGSFERHAGPTGNKRCDKCGKWLVSGSPCQCPRPQDEPQSTIAKLWDGYGTALKPAFEPVLVCMNPIDGTFANNALKHGVAGLNIDGCRVPLIEGIDDSQIRTMNRSQKEIDDGWGMNNNQSDKPQVVSK
jgi:hypothetical protein